MSMNNQITRRTLVRRAAATTLGSLATLPIIAPAQTFPNRPMRVIVPYPPGGSVTVVARTIAEKLGQRLGQTIVVDNKPGANGLIATEEMLKAPPDGHTLFLQANTHVINPLVMQAMPFDIMKDVAAVSTVYKLELLLVTHPSLPVSNLKEFIALARTSPGKINFGSADNAGLTHLAAETFNTAAGVKTQVIPYKGSGPALNDTLAGHIQGYFTSIPPAIPHIKAGKLKALAVSGKFRTPALPDVPTFEEAGLPGVEAAGSWCGLFVPAATPRPIVDRLAADVAFVMNTPEVKDFMISQGVLSYTIPPAQFEALLRSDTTRLAGVIKTSGMKLDK